jgi:hypothetical protein
MAPLMSPPDTNTSTVTFLMSSNYAEYIEDGFANSFHEGSDLMNVKVAILE